MAANSSSIFLESVIERPMRSGKNGDGALGVSPPSAKSVDGMLSVSLGVGRGGEHAPDSPPDERHVTLATWSGSGFIPVCERERERDWQCITRCL